MLKEAIVEWTAQHSGNAGEARKGISLQAIKSYLASNYNIDMKAKGPINHLKVATETAIESGQVVYAGTGHLRYKLGVAEKKAKAGAIAAARS
ncbi:hypothetical protein FA09DRAFT_330937 [Tilletiopsis washingtonensis]|uniref:Histone H1 n=1 Tax=Tilletiopsis washingtonensis TaxID=58919 RepID=A0A316Z7B0_9BASI|nr:hypothetical protein FA09DRAFT_330937 [Tilletiopsis washingtonensis]PWN96858.1 hypothetical protein FA09DRAFT_330937 [Tilletiopsis washingtonensis]